MDKIIMWAVMGLCAVYIYFAALKHYTKNSSIPYEAWLLVTGAIISFIACKFYPILSEIELPAGILLYLLIPIIIFNSGRKVHTRLMRANWFPILFLAIVGLVLQMFFIGWPISLLLNIPLSYALLLALIAGSTDPIAIFSVLDKYNIANRLKSIIEGESIFNDAGALVLFSLLSKIVTQQNVTLEVEAYKFLWALAGAVPFGLFLGWASRKIIITWCKTEFIEVNMTIALALLSFSLAEYVLHLSGVISTLCTAIAFTHSKGKLICMQSNLLDDLWTLANDFAKSLLFFLLGISLGLHNFPSSITFLPVMLLLLLARPFMVYICAPIFHLTKQKLSFKEQNILSLGGLKGGVSAAMALMIPHNFEYRNLFICFIYVIVFITVVFFPLLITLYLKQKQT